MDAPIEENYEGKADGLTSLVCKSLLRDLCAENLILKLDKKN